MEPHYEQHYHQVEARHWWFRARRDMVLRLVRQRASGPGCRILDVGCSSGLLLLRLQREGYRGVRGIDASSDGVRLCREAGLRADVMDAHAPDFPDATFDGLTASDVLEHLEHDAAALAEWRRVLKPGGWLILFVPAFMWLWTGHDTVNRHFRRYTRAQLVQRLADAGFEVERSSYWNTGLFLPVAALRLMRRCFRRDPNVSDAASDMFLPPGWVNALLRGWLGLENRLLGTGINAPVGVSVFVTARVAGGRAGTIH